MKRTHLSVQFLAETQREDAKSQSSNWNVKNRVDAREVKLTHYLLDALSLAQNPSLRSGFWVERSLFSRRVR